MTLLPQGRPARRSAVRRAKKRSLHTASEGSALTLPAGHILGQVQRSKIVAAVCALLLTVTLFEFFAADFFYVFDFDVVGLKYLTKGEVARASGLVGYNIFFIDPRSVERALMKLPEVKSAHVTIGLPHRLVVDIEERQPEITWLRGAETYWVDAEGIGFRARASLPQLVTVRDLDQSPVNLGEQVQPDAIAALRALREAWPDGPRTFEWSAARGLAFTEAHGWKIYLGGASDMAGKVAQLRALIPQLAAQNAKIKFIDLGKGDPYFQ